MFDEYFIEILCKFDLYIKWFSFVSTFGAEADALYSQNMDFVRKNVDALSVAERFD